jgi:hypothetical protein
MSKIHSVIFRPFDQTVVPNVAPWFPAVPSAFYGYYNTKGYSIPEVNDKGSEKEQVTS